MPVRCSYFRNQLDLILWKRGQDLLGTGLLFEVPLSNILFYNLGVQDSGSILGLVSPFQGQLPFDRCWREQVTIRLSVISKIILNCLWDFLVPSYTFSFFLPKSFVPFRAGILGTAGHPKLQCIIAENRSKFVVRWVIFLSMVSRVIQ